MRFILFLIIFISACLSRKGKKDDSSELPIIRTQINLKESQEFYALLESQDFTPEQIAQFKKEASKLEGGIYEMISNSSTGLKIRSTLLKKSKGLLIIKAVTAPSANAGTADPVILTLKWPDNTTQIQLNTEEKLLAFDSTNLYFSIIPLSHGMIHEASIQKKGLNGWQGSIIQIAGLFGEHYHFPLETLWLDQPHQVKQLTIHHPTIDQLQPVAIPVMMINRDTNNLKHSLLQKEFINEALYHASFQINAPQTAKCSNNSQVVNQAKDPTYVYFYLKKQISTPIHHKNQEDLLKSTAKEEKTPHHLSISISSPVTQSTVGKAFLQANIKNPNFVMRSQQNNGSEKDREAITSTILHEFGHNFLEIDHQGCSSASDYHRTDTGRTQLITASKDFRSLQTPNQEQQKSWKQHTSLEQDWNDRDIFSISQKWGNLPLESASVVRHQISHSECAFLCELDQSCQAFTSLVSSGGNQCALFPQTAQTCPRDRTIYSNRLMGCKTNAKSTFFAICTLAKNNCSESLKLYNPLFQPKIMSD